MWCTKFSTPCNFSGLTEAFLTKAFVELVEAMEQGSYWTMDLLINEPITCEAIKRSNH